MSDFRGLSREAYCDDAVYAEERQRIFRSCWHYVGATDQLKGSGDYLTDCLGEAQVLVCNAGDDGLQAFLNVCLHRCHEVAAGHGTAASLRCRYHGWTYSLNGRLLRAPGWSPNDGESPRLHTLPLARWGPLVFICPGEPRIPFDEWFEPIAHSLTEMGLDADCLEFERRDPWSFRANWKVGIENFLECYHCPATHAEMARHIDVKRNAVRLIGNRWTSTQIAHPQRHAENIFAPFDPLSEARYHYLWPTTTITVNPGSPSLLINSWRPNDARRTDGFEDSFFGPAVAPTKRAALIAYSTHIGEEDNALVESVQRGIQSLEATSIRLDGDEECLIAHFHQLVKEAMTS